MRLVGSVIHPTIIPDTCNTLTGVSDPTRRTAEEPPPRRRSVRRRVTLGSTAAALACGLLVSACGTDSGSDAESGQSPGAPSGCTTTSTSGQRDANLIPIPPAAVTVTSVSYTHLTLPTNREV